jgi:two-component system alkaline phosphatase synthesis response regulator PhoP
MEKKDLKTKKILLVEDDEFLLRSYKTKFQKLGIEAAIAHDGKEALALTKEDKPDLILLDIVMPVKDGFDFLEEFNALYGVGSVPVIALTNLGQDESIERGKELGVAEYMVKAHHSMQEVVDIVLKYLK